MNCYKYIYHPTNCACVISVRYLLTVNVNIGSYYQRANKDEIPCTTQILNIGTQELSWSKCFYKKYVVSINIFTNLFLLWISYQLCLFFLCFNIKDKTCLHCTYTFQLPPSAPTIHNMAEHCRYGIKH